MTEILSNKLLRYLRENYPDILFAFEDEARLTSYVRSKIESVNPLLVELLDQDRPVYIIEELCLQELMADLGPSKYNFIRELLEEEFFIEYHHLLRLKILRFEIINIVSFCDPLFEAFGFSDENPESKNLRYTITATIKEYFENSEKETLQWPTMHSIY